jgi:hypothetical protein
MDGEIKRLHRGAVETFAEPTQREGNGTMGMTHHDAVR